MKRTHPICYIIAEVTILLMSACRSNKQFTTSQQNTTTITAASIDSTAQHLMSTHRKTTTITFLPMQTFGLPPIPSPNVQAPAQDLITQLINQRGGTIIIQEEDTQSEDQTNTTTQISHQDTTTTQNNQYQKNTTNQPRASPNLKLILYILLAAITILLLLKWIIRQ
jgi:hypothetical protein